MAGFLKVCGLTREEDVALAVRHGATALGFVFWPRSPRFVAPSAAAALVRTVPAGVDAVGVFVNATAEEIRHVAQETGISLIQLHGDEDPALAERLPLPVVKAVGVEAASGTAWPAHVRLLLDATDRERRGGTGVRVDWDRAASIARSRPVVLAGGLTPENVDDAIARVRPMGVDVSSGVEQAPGRKDPARVEQFLARARAAFARLEDR